MILKLSYTIKNGFYNLIRTKGIVSTFILSLLIAIISFFCFTLFLFFNHIHQQMIVSLEKETDFISLQMASQAVMSMFIFKLATLLLFISLTFLLIGYMKSSFKQFFITQKKAYKTMSLLGESSINLQLFYTSQVVIFSFFVITLGSFLGNKIFFASVINTLHIVIDDGSVNQFESNLIIYFFAFTLILIYIATTTFFSSNKKILAVIS